MKIITIDVKTNFRYRNYYVIVMLKNDEGVDEGVKEE